MPLNRIGQSTIVLPSRPRLVAGAAIAGKKVSPYGAQALVRRSLIPAGFVTEHTNLEDIILFLAQEGR